MKLTLLSADDVRRALPMQKAIEVAKQAFAAQSTGQVQAPLRSSLEVEPVGGTLLVMPAHLRGTGLAAKLVSIFPRNGAQGRPVIHGLVVVLNEESGEPEALIDGTFLTAWRTAAATGAATDLLAVRDARIGAVLGTGAQARTQVLALTAVRQLDEIRIWSRDREHVREFVRDLGPGLRCRLVAAASPAEALAGAQVVVTATPAGEPVFHAQALEPGAHLSAVGSFTHDMCEWDPDLARSARIFVDDRAACLAESGELARARAAGLTSPEDWIELGSVVSGDDPGRRGADERTLFKSVGLAVQDVTAAAAALASARREGLGRQVDF